MLVGTSGAWDDGTSAVRRPWMSTFYLSRTEGSFQKAILSGYYFLKVRLQKAPLSDSSALKALLSESGAFRRHHFQKVVL